MKERRFKRILLNSKMILDMKKIIYMFVISIILVSLLTVLLIGWKKIDKFYLISVTIIGVIYVAFILYLAIRSLKYHIKYGKNYIPEIYNFIEQTKANNYQELKEKLTNSNYQLSEEFNELVEREDLYVVIEREEFEFQLVFNYQEIICVVAFKEKYFDSLPKQYLKLKKSEYLAKMELKLEDSIDNLISFLDKVYIEKAIPMSNKFNIRTK